MRQIAAAAVLVAIAAVATALCPKVMTPGGAVDLNPIGPVVHKTKVNYTFGIPIPFYIGVDPCHITNATTVPGGICPAAYVTASLTSVKLFPHCAESFPLIQTPYAYNATLGATTASVLNPLDGRIVHLKFYCDKAAEVQTLLGYPWTNDAHHYHVNVATKHACPL